MGLFNIGSFFDRLLNPIEDSGGLVNDPVIQGRLNNENNSGVYNSVDPNSIQIPAPTPERTLEYATTGSMPNPDGQVAGANTSSSSLSGGGGGDGGGGSGNDGGLSASIALARQAAEEGRRRAGEAYNRARGIYDEGIGLLGQRRKEFGDIYATGQNDILGAYEGERGNLQASSQGANQNLRNSLRALGLGGSAFLKGQGRLRQQQAGAAGDLSADRSRNDRENLSGYNTNQQFANTQESSLNRFLQDAQNSRTSAEAQIGLSEQGDVNQINQNVNQLLSNIYAQESALRASGGDIAGYKANPYAANIGSVLESLNGASTAGIGAQGAQNQASNVVGDTSLSSLIDPRKRIGGSIYNA